MDLAISVKVLGIRGVRASDIETKDVEYLGERTAYRSVATVPEISKANAEYEDCFSASGRRQGTNDHANEILFRDHVEESPYTHAANARLIQWYLHRRVD